MVNIAVHDDVLSELLKFEYMLECVKNKRQNDLVGLNKQQKDVTKLQNQKYMDDLLNFLPDNNGKNCSISFDLKFFFIKLIL